MSWSHWPGSLFRICLLRDFGSQKGCDRPGCDRPGAFQDCERFCTVEVLFCSQSSDGLLTVKGPAARTSKSGSAD